MEYKSDEEEHQAKRQRQICPYLDTINRHVLDFDFQKLCSISLSNLNAYCCLVCGKYFQVLYTKDKKKKEEKKWKYGKC